MLLQSAKLPFYQSVDSDDDHVDRASPQHRREETVDKERRTAICAFMSAGLLLLIVFLVINGSHDRKQVLTSTSTSATPVQLPYCKEKCSNACSQIELGHGHGQCCDWQLVPSPSQPQTQTTERTCAMTITAQNECYCATVQEVHPWTARPSVLPTLAPSVTAAPSVVHSASPSSAGSTHSHDSWQPHLLSATPTHKP